MIKDSTKVCVIQDCGRPVKTQELCRTHYGRFLTQGIYGGSIQRRRNAPQKDDACEIEDCGRPQRTGGLCKTHYERFLATKERGGPIRVTIPRPDRCIQDGCINQAYAHELCRRHYDQWKAKRSTEQCTIQDCERLVFRRDWCRGHYDRWIRTGDPGSSSFERTNKNSEECSIEGCERPKSRREWCDPHYKRWWKTGDVHAETPFMGTRGKGHVDKTTGYRYIAGVAEHRMVMEEVLDRPLVPGENVHHKNGVRDDNRPCNLEIWSIQQPPGQRNADKLQHAFELIELNRGNADFAEAWRRVYIEQGLVANACT